MNKTKSVIIAAALVAAGAVAFVGCKSGGHHDHSSHMYGSPSTTAAKPYPLKTCIVTDEKLGDHGQPYSFVYQGQEIKMCCDDCRKDFDKDPAKYLQKLSAAK